MTALLQHLLTSHGWDSSSSSGKPPYAATDMHPDPQRTYSVIFNSYDRPRVIVPGLQLLFNTT